MKQSFVVTKESNMSGMASGILLDEYVDGMTIIVAVEKWIQYATNMQYVEKDMTEQDVRKCYKEYFTKIAKRPTRWVKSRVKGLIYPPCKTLKDLIDYDFIPDYSEAQLSEKFMEMANAC
jgi:hypothetical protein